MQRLSDRKFKPACRNGFNKSSINVRNDAASFIDVKFVVHRIFLMHSSRQGHSLFCSEFIPHDMTESVNIGKHGGDLTGNRINAGVEAWFIRSYQ